MYVLFVSLLIAVVHALLLYHWYVNVVLPGSLTFAVNVIVLHSFPLFVTLYAVGATLFHTYLTVPLAIFPAASLTWIKIFPDVGSFCVHILQLAVAFQSSFQHLYGFESNPSHSSFALIFIVNACTSFTHVQLTVNVGSISSTQCA